MGYACPVCGTPQADARHLANHLAFTGMLHGADHEAWLDEHAPGWADAGEVALAERVRDLADEADYPRVFEDTTGRGERGHGHDDPPAERSGALSEDAGDAPAVDPAAARARVSTPADAPMDAETRAMLAEARELTREMLAPDAGGADEVADDATDPEGDGADP